MLKWKSIPILPIAIGISLQHVTAYETTTIYKFFISTIFFSIRTYLQLCHNNYTVYISTNLIYIKNDLVVKEGRVTQKIMT
jgi:hypothetical protein